MEINTIIAFQVETFWNHVLFSIFIVNGFTIRQKASFIILVSFANINWLWKPHQNSRNYFNCIQVYRSPIMFYWPFFSIHLQCKIVRIKIFELCVRLNLTTLLKWRTELISCKKLMWYLIYKQIFLIHIFDAPI